MSRPHLAVLGGSSPFTAAFFDAVATASGVPPAMDVTVHGRDAAAIDAVSAYGHYRLEPLGWTVRGTADITDALSGANLVMHQIRYGDLRGRQEDEALANELGLPGDESLGPAGLAAAVRMAPGLGRTADCLARVCPEALVVNLTNPLSVSTALLHRRGRRVVGVCELPQFTFRQACAVLEVAPGEVEWAYSGLNHRGFIHRMQRDGEDLLRRLPERLGTGTIGGIDARTISTLGALPLKYFTLFRPGTGPPPGRAQLLAELRTTILSEMRECPRRSPPTLDRRPQPWYRDAVVPLLAALVAEDPTEHVLNLPDAQGLVREVRTRVSAEGITEVADPRPDGEPARWLERFEQHEGLVVAAALDPSPTRLRAALASDPMLPDTKVDAALAMLTP